MGGPSTEPVMQLAVKVVQGGNLAKRSPQGALCIYSSPNELGLVS